jgi:hypothetical protein
LFAERASELNDHHHTTDSRRVKSRKIYCCPEVELFVPRDGRRSRINFSPEIAYGTKRTRSKTNETAAKSTKLTDWSPSIALAVPRRIRHFRNDSANSHPASGELVSYRSAED